MEIKKYVNAAELLLDTKYSIFRTFKKVDDIITAKGIIESEGNRLFEVQVIGPAEELLVIIDELDKMMIDTFKQRVTV